MIYSESFYKKCNVLYLEKKSDNSEFFLNLLEKTFYKVYYFDNSDLALECIKNEENKIDIIISEIDLEKEMIGLKLLKKVRAKKDIPFILFANKYDSEVLISAIKYGITDFIEKPITNKIFFDTLERVFKNNIYFETKKETRKDLEEIVKVVNEIALVFKTNTKNEVISANSFFYKILNYSTTDIINKKNSFFKEENVSLNTINKTIFDAKVWEGKIKILSRDKNEYYVYLTVIPTFNKNSNEIDEFTWISFLANEYELGQKNFRKKVIQSINNNRRINTEARKKIDELQSKLANFQNLDFVYEQERNKKEKFQSQFNYFDNEAKASKKKLEKIKEKAKVKLKSILEEQKKVEVKKEQTSIKLDLVNNELDLKNKTISELSTELKKQESLINKLMLEIKNRELKLGLNEQD